MIHSVSPNYRSEANEHAYARCHTFPEQAGIALRNTTKDRSRSYASMSN